MRIHIVAALAASLLGASACGSDGGSAPQAGPAASVSVTASPPASAAVGSSAGTFTVKVVDAKGLGVAGNLVTFSTTGAATVSPTSATTDASGLASTQVTLGTVTGTAAIRANAAGVTTAVASVINVIAGAASKVVVTPKAIRLVSVGDTARIVASAQDQYGNLAGANTISYSVVDASLVSVDQTGLVRALKQGGTTFVISSSSGKADTTVATVLAAGASICTGLVNPTAMNVGDVQTFSGAQYGCLPGSAAGAEFAMTMFNSSVDQVNAQNVSVTGSGVATPPSTFTSPMSGTIALRSVFGRSSTPAPPLDESFHLQLQARAGAQFKGGFARARAAWKTQASRSLSPTGLNTVSRAVIPAAAQVGDVFPLNVSANICTGAVNHGVRVAALGTKSIILTDTLNPAGGFTDADYQRFAARFDTLVHPLVVGAFGAPSDLDNNGRVAIIFTRSVNELVDSTSGFFVGGFFNPRDIFPKKGQTTADDCPGSNEGEMFYMVVPAPSGINGVKHTTGFVDSVTTGIIAHEFQHLINAGRRYYINTAATDFEEVWLNEGLSHIAEELLYYRESGLAPRANLNDTTIRIINRPTYGFWKSDAASNFSRLLPFLRSPGANSLFANNDELATRGAAWSFLRYAADRLGTTDGTIWQRFANSTVTGLATLQSVFGSDPVPLIRDWNVANIMDDYPGNADPRFTHPSWNFRDIYTKTFLNIPNYPLRVTGLSDNVKTDFQIRGGSSSYARVAMAPGKDGLLTFSSGGGLPNSSLQFIVVRTK